MVTPAVQHQFQQKTRDLIDRLKGICASHGLGNDGNEFKIITQVFLYKFLCDKYAWELKTLEPKLANADNWETEFAKLSDRDRAMIDMQLGPQTARLTAEQLITHLFNRQNEAEFGKLFDDTLRDIAAQNNAIFAVQTEGGAKITLFDRVTEYINDSQKRSTFAKAIISALVEVSFEDIFTQSFDFYATLFEYLIKDYNSDSGGKYAEYYTPHAVAKIMAQIMVPPDQRGKIQNATVYDPSAGSGSLLMNLAHAIGTDRCAIYSQDISQKSSHLLRLNLILNGLVHSIQNIIEGNTILHPFHKDGEQLKHFDYIVSNPPFKMDFSDFRDDLESDSHKDRFFAGIPKIPAKAKDKMAIYSLFLQHVIGSLKPGGKAAVVVPTGFITAQSGIDKKIRQKLIDDKMLAGVVSMPSNIFATTGTNVSIVFIDASNESDVVLIDASNLGEKVKDGKNQKTLLSLDEEQRIIDTFNAKQAEDDFSVVVSYDDIAAKNYSLSAGQYFDVKIEYVDISPEEFAAKLTGFQDRLDSLFAESREMEVAIADSLGNLSID